VLVAQVSGTKEVQLKGYFLAGLRKEIREKFHPHKPKDLSSAMELAANFKEAEKEGNLEVELCSRGFHFQPKGGTWIHNVGGSATNTFHNNNRQNQTLTGEACSSANVIATNQSESTSSGSRNRGV